MRIVINAVTARLGGGITYLQNLLPAIHDVAPFFTVTVLAGPQLAARLDAPTARVQVINRNRPWLAAASATAWVREHGRQYDLLYSPGNIALPLAGLPQVVAVRNMLLVKPLPLPSSFHGRFALSVRSRLAQMSVRTTDATVVPSEAMRLLLVQRVPTARHHVITIPHGVPDDLAPDVEGGSRLRSRLGLDNRLTVVYPTLAAPHKDQMTVVEAMAHVRTDFHLVLIGPALEPAVKARINEPDVRHRIRVLDPLEPTQMLALYGLADLCVWSSLAEAFGFPLIEAMRCRIPVVAADTDVNRELAGDTVLYHRQSDPVSLAAALEDAVRLPAGDRLERAYCRSLSFNWRSTASKLVALFRAVQNERDGAQLA